MTPKHTTKSKVKAYHGQPNNEPSLTVQGDSQSLAEIIDRFQKTGFLKRNQAEFVDVEDIDDITKYHRQGNDFTDLDDVRKYAHELQHRIKEEERRRRDEIKNPNPEPLREKDEIKPLKADKNEE